MRAIHHAWMAAALMAGCDSALETTPSSTTSGEGVGTTSATKTTSITSEGGSGGATTSQEGGSGGATTTSQEGGSGGATTSGCGGGAVDCYGSCVDTMGDAANCGACEHVCDTPPLTKATCEQGQCVIACLPGFGDCDDDPTDGCETPLSHDLANCGACGHACAAPHATNACIQGSCEMACDLSWADCNGDPTDGCETNLSTDPSSCGQCGNVCVTGECWGPYCAPETAVMSNSAVSGILIEGGDIVWSETFTNRLYSAPLSGVPIYGGTQIATAGALLGGMAIDATHVYWQDDAGVWSLPRAGGSATMLASGSLASDGALAVDAVNVYWIDASLGKLMKTPLGGGASTPLADSYARSRAMVSDGAAVFFASWDNTAGWAVKRASVDGTSVTIIDQDTAGWATGIALDGPDVVWLGTINTTLPERVVLRRAPRAGGAMVEIWRGPVQESTSLLLLGGNAYFRGLGTLYGVPLTGGELRQVGGCNDYIFNNAALATDGVSLYCQSKWGGAGITRNYP